MSGTDLLVTAGVPGLVGITGIIGTFFAPAWADRAASCRRERRAFRTAQRLVLEELETVQVHFELLLESDRLPIRDLGEGYLPTAAWNKYKAVLAEMVRDNDWEGIPTVMGTLDHHRLLLAEHGQGMPLTP